MDDNNQKAIEKAADYVAEGITAYQNAIDKAISVLCEDGLTEDQAIDIINQIIGALHEEETCSGDCDCGCEHEHE